MKQNRFYTIYRCFEDGKFVCKGTKQEIAEAVNDDRIFNIGTMCDGKLHYGKYYFEYVGKRKVAVEINEPKPTKPVKDKRFEERFQIVYEHLLRDGITCLSDRDKAEKFIPLLKEKGLVCTSRKGKELLGFRKIKYYDILEVVK